MGASLIFEILLNNNESIEFTLWGEQSDADNILKIDKEEALENGEAEIQIKEGHSYEYLLKKGYSLSLFTSNIVKPFKSDNGSGRIVPNNYVGTLSIDIIDESNQEKCGKLDIEVRSAKATYRDDYRTMLEDITEKCTDLILLHSSPVTQNFESDFDKDQATLYQRFAFIKSVLDSNEFNDAIHKVVSSPVTTWKSFETEKDIRNIKRIGSRQMRQITSSPNRINLHDAHPLNQKGILKSVPEKITDFHKRESIDTPENRFVKYALTSFLNLIGEIRIYANNKSRLYSEARVLDDHLEQILAHTIFKEIGILTKLPLNSPVLQRKEGYREVLRAWIMFDLAAKLIWKGGDDVYAAGKRDVATLYEYWLFFKLLDVVKEVFNVSVEDLSKLIVKTGDTLGLQLKQGKHVAIQGTYKNEVRDLNIEFSFNKTFSGKKEYPLGGSWTKNMRPDYTLSIWPVAINKEEAEKEELIVHIHFDAKYKIEKLTEILDENSDEDIEVELDRQKEEETKGTYKRIDLLKMHAYKDAIRRTGGAYVLYPGKDYKPYHKSGFREILPGLGAFAIRPEKSNDGSLELKEFLNDVVKHFLNRASQREKTAYRTYDIHKEAPGSEVSESLPETYGINRSLIPDETFVLVGFYKSDMQLKWIEQNGLYNLRTGSKRGSLNLLPEITGAKYLLLHGKNETKTGRLIKLKNDGPVLYSKQDLLSKKYPDPSGDFYLLFKTETEIEAEFDAKM